MANTVSIKVSTDSKAAAEDFRKLTTRIHEIEGAAKRAGSGITSMANAAEHSLGRMAARAAQARREIEQLSRARAAPSPFGAATGGGFIRGPSLGATAIGAGAGFALAGGTAAAGAAFGYGYSNYQEQVRNESFLASAAKQTGQAYAAQASEVAKLRKELGLTQAQALELQAQSLRFTGTIGKPQDAGRLSRALANALAASGRSPNEIPSRLQQLSTGQDELFDVLGPVKIGKSFASSPEGIYKAYAREILNVNRELTDLEKTQARYYAVLQAGAAAEGAAAARLETTAGKVDVLKSRLDDLSSSFVKGAVEARGFQAALAAVGVAAENRNSGYVAEQLGTASIYTLFPGLIAAGGIGTSLDNIRQGFAMQRGTSAPTVQGTPVSPPGIQQRIDAAVAAAFGGRVLGRSPLDTPTYLSRDPFADNATDRLRLASERAVNRSEYFNLRERTRGGALGLVGSAAGDFGNIVGYGDRLAAFRQSETPQERASRVFSISSRFGAGAYAALSASGAFSDADARARSEAEQRRFLISGLGNVDPSELTADQQRAYEDALVKAQEDSLKNAIETLSNVIKMQKDLKRLADKLAGDDTEPEPVILQIDNRSDTVARFAGLIASGDSLRSDDR